MVAYDDNLSPRYGIIVILFIVARIRYVHIYIYRPRRIPGVDDPRRGGFVSINVAHDRGE